MSRPFERARSPEAKQQREAAILRAAQTLGERAGIRTVTLTDIAAEVGMHKSAMLRYFETRELIFLRLAAAGWQDWSAAVNAGLARMASSGDPAEVARVLATTLVERPLFCDLLAHVPLNLERKVSTEAVRAFKLAGAEAREPIERELIRLLGVSSQQATDVVATAVSLAGAFWQTANPGPVLSELYRSDPQLAHAVIDVESRLSGILTALLTAWRTTP